MSIVFTNRLVLLSILVAGVVMAGCAGSRQAEPRPDTDVGEPLPTGEATDAGNAAGMQVVGFQLIGDWTLSSLNGHSLVEGSTITAGFDGMQITGTACNHYFGDYAIEGSGISFSNIGSTDMFCEGTMEQEQEYFDALADVNGWTLEGATLEFFGETAYLVFERVVPVSDAGLEGPNWVLESFIIGGDAVSSVMAGTTITATIVDGRISGNATCNDYSGAVTIDGAGITISDIAATEMACEVGMEQENQYLATLAAVSTWRIDGTTLTLSADNGSSLVFR